MVADKCPTDAQEGGNGAEDFMSLILRSSTARFTKAIMISNQPGKNLPRCPEEGFLQSKTKGPVLWSCPPCTLPWTIHYIYKSNHFLAQISYYSTYKEFIFKIQS